MLRPLLPFCTAILLFAGLHAQNIVPNPSFENRTSCPTGISQFDGYVTNWTRSTTASSDYSGCGFTGNSAIRNAPSTGQSSLGGWGGASHPSCSNNAYIEGARVNLTQTMTMGQTYRVEFRVRVDPTGSATAAPNNCVDVGIYLYNSASPPAPNGWCCLNVTPQVSIPGGSVPQGGYLTVSGTVVAGNWNALIIGPFCNGNTSGSACSNYTSSRMYFNIDDVVVEPQVVLDAADLNLEAEALASFNSLHWEVADPSIYQQYVLERSLDGVEFTTVSEQLSDKDQQLYQHLDQDPAEGLSFYRLVGLTLDGGQRTSAVVTLQRTGHAAPDGGNLNLFFDERSQEIKFSIDAGEGGAFELTMSDMNGREIFREVQQASSGLKQFSLPVSGLARGIYALRLRSLGGEAVWQAKWVH